MYRTPRLILTITVLILTHSYIYGQLSVYAGPDTILCESISQEYQIGNYVWIEGDYDSISYSWSCEYSSPIGTFYASTFLNDTSISHPTFITGFDTLSFTLEISDYKGNKASDTVTIIVSHFIYCLADCVEFIYEGDSVKLWHCIDGGIPPYIYIWDNEESLSNPTIPDPWAKPDTFTVYSLILTDSAGCVAYSNCRVTVIPTSVEHSGSNNYFVRVFPNPVSYNGQIFIENPSMIEIEIKFYDIQGRLIYEGTINENQTLIDSNNFLPGVYIYKVVMQENIIQNGKIFINLFRP